MLGVENAVGRLNFDPPKSMRPTPRVSWPTRPVIPYPPLAPSDAGCGAGLKIARLAATIARPLLRLLVGGDGLRLHARARLQLIHVRYGDRVVRLVTLPRPDLNDVSLAVRVF